MRRWLVAEGVAAASQSYSVVLEDVQLKQPIGADDCYLIRVMDTEGLVPDGVPDFFSVVEEYDGSDL